MSNIVKFPIPRRVPSFIEAWAPFMIVLEAQGDEALPIRGRATAEGPQIEFCHKYINPDRIEDWTAAIFWLSPCVMQVAMAVLTEGLRSFDGIGCFSSPRWTAFRDAVSEEMTMEWNEILDAARREGVDFMADNIAANLIIESGIVDTLEIA